MTNSAIPDEVRHFLSRALVWSGVGMAVIAIWIIWAIIWGGHFSNESEKQRLTIIGVALFTVLGGVILALIGELLGTSVKSLKFNVNKEGASGELDSDENAPSQGGGQ